jgi:hypothetical protein
MEKITKSNKRRAFNKAVGPGKKNPKLINVGPTFIPDYRIDDERLSSFSLKAYLEGFVL